MKNTGCILVTGFEPFGGESINPTGMIIERLPEEIDGYKIIRLVLPVEFNRCVELASDAYDRYSPKAVIMLGQARGRSAITPETVGKNIMNARIPDNAGYKPENVRIEEEGPQTRYSTLPVLKIISAARKMGIPVEKSESAGEYVCNNLLYGMLGHVNGKVPTGFIHVPFIREQGHEPYLEFDGIYKGIVTAIKTVIDNLENNKSETVFASKRSEWRNFLKKNHNKLAGAWLVFPTVNTGEQSILYNDAVEEALCFGWIDSIMKHLDEDHCIRRFTPRRQGSPYSRPNIERLIKMDKKGKILPEVRESVRELIETPFEYPEDILEELKKDPVVWRNYNRFTEPYKRIRISYINDARKRPEEFRKRLEYFIEKTREKKIIPGYGGIDKYY